MPLGGLGILDGLIISQVSCESMSLLGLDETDWATAACVLAEGARCCRGKGGFSKASSTWAHLPFFRAWTSTLREHRRAAGP